MTACDRRGQRSYRALASGVTGAKIFTRPPSGSRRIIERSGGRPELSDDRCGPGGGQAGYLLPEGREALDVVGDHADRDEFHDSSFRSTRPTLE